MNKKLSVTVGITALNEENNIKNIINSLLRQHNYNHILKEIIIVSDGSVDNTAKIAKSIKSKKIKVYDFSNREGMTKRLNFIFNKFNTDILIKIDADLLPVNNNMLNEIVQPFLEDEKVGLVGGKLIAKNVTTYVEKIIHVSRMAWDGIKSEYMEGDSFYSLPGGIYALSKKFSKYAFFPNNIWSDVGYVYYVCIKNGFKFKSNKKALVYLNLPSNIKDYVRQISRYGSQVEPLVEMFGEEVKKQYRVPFIVTSKHKLLVFIKYPIECIILFILNIYVKIFTLFRNINNNAMWQTAVSSKRKIS